VFKVDLNLYYNYGERESSFKIQILNSTPRVLNQNTMKMGTFNKLLTEGLCPLNLLSGFLGREQPMDISVIHDFQGT
jgi:hypothetical protein